MIFGIVFTLLWIFVIAPIALSVPKNQTWLEQKYEEHNILFFVFWPYFLIRNYIRGAK